MLEIERQKIISLEDEKRELTEALEAAKSEYGTLQAMHERVWIILKEYFSYNRHDTLLIY